MTNDIPYIYLPSTWSLNQMRKYIYGPTMLHAASHRMNKQIREEIGIQRCDDSLDAIASMFKAVRDAEKHIESKIVVDKDISADLVRAINAGPEVAIPLAPFAKGGVVDKTKEDYRYAMRMPDGSIKPLNVYQKVGGEWKPVTIHPAKHDDKENIHKRNTPEPTELLNEACPFITTNSPYERPACIDCASYEFCNKVNKANYKQSYEAEWVGEPVLPNFIDTSVEVYKVFNIHFEPGKPFEDIEIPVVKPFVTFWKDYHPDATEEECHAHYVKAILFHRNDLKFEYKLISPGANKEEYDRAIRDHMSRKEFRCAADDADNIIPPRNANDPDDRYIYYHRPWMYVVIPNSYNSLVEAVVGGRRTKRLEQQMIWEYLLNTLKISVEYQYGDAEE